MMLFTATQLPWNLLHHHEAIACTPGEHPDLHACHISVHHLAGENLTACQHKAHLSAKEDHCTICNYHFTKHIMLPASAENMAACFFDRSDFRWVARDMSQNLEHFNNRGPPVV
jgi:hypothetical protein